MTILYICGIVGNIVLKICLKIIPSDFLLIRGSLLTSNIIALILITSYSTFMLLIILETITLISKLLKTAQEVRSFFYPLSSVVEHKTMSQVRFLEGNISETTNKEVVINAEKA